MSAASRARGSAWRSSTARSALPRSPVSGVIGISCRTRSLIRTLCSLAARVSRSHARTRRSSAAASGPGSSSCCRPPGSAIGIRASVSASIPFDLACRRRNLRRSAALAEDTRYTAWPRPAKNTAIGIHAGPVGSNTTASRVPAGAPASAARSTADQRLHRRHARRPAHRPPVSLQHPHRVPRRDPQVNPDQPPCPWLPSSCSIAPHRASSPDSSAPAARQAAAQSATVPGRKSPATAPTHVLQPGQPVSRAGPLPSCGSSVARPAVAIKSARPGINRPQNLSVATYRTSRGCSCNPGTPR